MAKVLIFGRALLLSCGCVPSPLDAGTTDTTAATTTTPTQTQTPTSTTTTTDGDTTSHAIFIAAPDIPPSIQCDVFAQDCRQGQKCVPFAADGGAAWSGLKCVDITGDAAPGEPCTTPDGPLAGADNCDAASICWDVDDTNLGTCVSQCTGTPRTPNCPEGDQPCAMASEGVLALCFPPCHPLQDDCPDGKFCVPLDDQFRCILQAENNGEINDPCQYINACQQDLACIPAPTASSACDPDAPGCCTPFCQLPGAPCPNPDQQCLPWYDPMHPISPGYEDLGVCAIPE